MSGPPNVERIIAVVVAALDGSSGDVTWGGNIRIRRQCCHLSSDLTIGGVHPGQVTVTRSHEDLGRENISRPEI